MRGFIPFLIALLLLATSVRADDAPETILVGFGDVPADARDCILAGNASVDECDREYQRTLQSLRDVNSAIDSGLKKKAQGGIDVLIPYGDARSWFLQTGVHLGAAELTMDEVRSDPVRRAVDDDLRAKGLNPGSWVRHTIEVRPRINSFYRPAPDGPLVVNNLFLGFLPQFSVDIQVIRHYEFPVDFPVDVRERALSLKKLLTAHLRNYLQLPTEVSGGSLRAGESVQLESYLSATAPQAIVNRIASATTSALGMGFGVGVFARAGFEYFQTIRYRRYTIQKRPDDKLRLILESPTLKRWGPYADVGFGLDLGLIDTSVSIARGGYRWLNEKNFSTEYLVDLSSPEVRHALKMAYLWGDFDEAKKLADEDCKSQTGIHKTLETNARDRHLGTHARGWRVRVLKWGWGNTRSRTDQIDTPFDCGREDPAVTTHVEELQKVRQGFRATRIFNVGIQTQSAPDFRGHSLWVKMNFTGSSASHDEALEFLRVASLVADPSDEANTAKIRKELDELEAQSKDKRTRRMHAYVSLHFDAEAIENVLSMNESSRGAAFRAAWNKVMGADSPETSKDAGEYKNHLKALTKFLAAAKKGIEQKDDLSEAKAFLSGLEKAGIDLYPFAAMLASLPDTDHVLATAQIYLAGKTRGEDLLIDPVHVGRLFNQGGPATFVKNPYSPGKTELLQRP